MWIGVAVLVVVLDQSTKAIMSDALRYGIPLPVFPGFNLTLMHNTGAAFSLLAGASGWQRWLFAGLAVVVSVIIVYLLRQTPPTQRWMALALALILGGAIGNLWDRITLGYVVDFIQVYYREWAFPAFNIADSAISVGAVVLVLQGICGDPKPDPGA